MIQIAPQDTAAQTLRDVTLYRGDDAQLYSSRPLGPQRLHFARFHHAQELGLTVRWQAEHLVEKQRAAV